MIYNITYIDNQGVKRDGFKVKSSNYSLAVQCAEDYANECGHGFDIITSGTRTAEEIPQFKGTLE